MKIESGLFILGIAQRMRLWVRRKERLGRGNDRTLCEGGKEIRHPRVFALGVKRDGVSDVRPGFD